MPAYYFAMYTIYKQFEEVLNFNNAAVIARLLGEFNATLKIIFSSSFKKDENKKKRHSHLIFFLLFCVSIFLSSFFLLSLVIYPLSLSFSLSSLLSPLSLFFSPLFFEQAIVTTT